jgi:hypothetical protein
MFAHLLSMNLGECSITKQEAESIVKRLRCFGGKAGTWREEIANASAAAGLVLFLFVNDITVTLHFCLPSKIRYKTPPTRKETGELLHRPFFI